MPAYAGMTKLGSFLFSMPQVLLLLNHLLHFFVLPLAWAALLCLGTQLVFRAQVQRSGRPWLRRCLITAGLGCALTFIWLPISGGQSSVAYYSALGLVLMLGETIQLRLWQAG